MPVTAFEGLAGTGKTHSLMEELGARLRNRALATRRNRLESLISLKRVHRLVGVQDALVTLEAHNGIPAVKSTKEWVLRQRRVLGLQKIASDEIRRRLDQTLAARRRHGATRRGKLLAMTIQQAKNQQFEHVVVIWPYRVPNDNEQKRRLLYNAITRAQRSCHILVQAQQLLDMPPFV